MPSYANFDIIYDEHGDTIYDFLFAFFGDCENMVKTPEGFIFSLIDGTSIRISITLVKTVEIKRKYIFFTFHDENLYDTFIPFNSIVQIKVLPENPNRWDGG